ncbi:MULTISPECIES: ECF transporter S component [unclassified Paenibacillus]|uniref:ECF transporter S component n=1 Tax=unclassified Paenibacillus TaxID=185978 RepID=UPI000953EE60|nr:MULTISPECIES: ECF transporter S component [unclassified Paenibacillus]SIR43013.1 energy-coupling factor transport system substrate-specific component [Paenibacillus sp. RU4X]SIR53058.1 energy-coupling factor transport system substrate-specific component [Paenibacillus sp. RU4T]
MSTAMPNADRPKGLTLADILVTLVVAVVFGIIYRIWNPMYDILKPLGLHAEQLSYGMWFMAGTFAFLLIRKPGAALLAETAAAALEAFMGGSWGASTLVYGVLQGLGAEIIFAAFLYRKAGPIVTILASLGSAVVSIFIDAHYSYIDKMTAWNYTLFVSMRLLGSVVIAGLFAWALAKALERTGVLSLIHPASDKDYEALG